MCIPPQKRGGRKEKKGEGGRGLLLRPLVTVAPRGGVGKKRSDLEGQIGLFCGVGLGGGSCVEDWWAIDGNALCRVRREEGEINVHSVFYWETWASCVT